MIPYLGLFHDMGEVLYEIRTDGCEEKFYDWKICCCKFSLLSQPQMRSSTVLVRGVPHLNFLLHEKHDYFLVIQPITLLICSVVVAVAIRNMIGWMGKNNRAARAARILVQFLDVACQKTTWNFQMQREPAEVYKSFIFWLFMKIIRPNQMKGHFADFEQHDKHEIIADRSTYRKWSEFFV